MDSDREPDEYTQLLPQAKPRSVVSSTTGSTPTSPLPRSSSPRPTRQDDSLTARRVILSVAILLLVLNTSSYISFAPETAILLDLVCKEHLHRLHPQAAHHLLRANDICKSPAVQGEVAYIIGWRSVFEMVPAIALAVPCGILADRFGRKPVLLLAIVGCFMNDAWVRMIFWFHDIFPLRMVWLGGLWQLIGAGAVTLQSVAFVMVADVCPADQRTTAFSQIQSAQMLAQFLFIPVGGSLVSRNPWIALLISSACMVIGFVGAVFFLPETQRSDGMVSAVRVSSVSVNNDDDDDDDDDGNGEDDNDNKKKSQMCFGFPISATSLAAGFRWATAHARVILVLTCFFTYHLGDQAGQTLLLQYASIRLDWSLGRASYLISMGAGINLVVHALAIPALSSFLLWRLHLHEVAKDKRLAQLSGVFLIAGSALTFLATSGPGLVIGEILTSSGLVFAVPARSMVTSMVSQDHVAALYTILAVLTYAGVLTGSPLLAAAFQWGMGLGGFWIGMPFLLAGICFLLSFLAVSMAPEAGQRHQGSVDGDEEVESVG